MPGGSPVFDRRQVRFLQQPAAAAAAAEKYRYGFYALTGTDWSVLHAFDARFNPTTHTVHSFIPTHAFHPAHLSPTCPLANPSVYQVCAEAAYERENNE